MKEELEEIGKQLKKWCDRYAKEYVTMWIMNGNINANVDIKDKDYEKLNVFIREK